MDDVLAGMIGALMASGLPCRVATALGACLHGKAGNIAADVTGQLSLLPSHLIESASQALSY